MTKRAALVLEDGRAFRGYRFGASVDGAGEVVFNTGMTGYQEICTDPSYRGQIVALTYPIIGNYGATRLDDESRQPWLSALVVRENCSDYSNWRAEVSLDRYLAEHGIPGISGVDTRALTRHLRSRGTLRGVICDWDETSDPDELTARARGVPSVSEVDLVAQTSITEPYVFGGEVESFAPAKGTRIVVVDCGIKMNILRSLRRRGIQALVVPHDCTVGDILEPNPAGVVISNGPGDPALMAGTVQVVRELVDRQVPLLGICLGHQILGRAIGGTTSRLKFGHHGGNHPVKDLRTGRVYITSQNHEFQVDQASIPTDSGFFVSQINLNDCSVEGLAHQQLPIVSVQYHPEGSPGPQDNQYLFDRFLSLTLRAEK
ncbi:MAG: glutamine-hydrolyzing carbamoyl-phosphate synthase small subunit [Chloroflexi bacterium]|nr:glutamine-hydrolyzing carbamoyl-phosphate synthase small subunit [Chloroflexota bacterium]